ncbi:MAG TPA: hypothetical protein EYP85_00230 [Armatimonadetes bacterium]|nr:hypothetical protein [Armatimonadota bacterium]
MSRRFFRCELGEFYPASLEKAVERVNCERGRKLFLRRRGDCWEVRKYCLLFPVTVLKVEGREAEVRGPEGEEVLMEYLRRVARQEPLRRLILDLRFAEIMQRELGEDSGE